MIAGGHTHTHTNTDTHTDTQVLLLSGRAPLASPQTVPAAGAASTQEQNQDFPKNFRASHFAKLSGTDSNPVQV